MKKLLIIPLLFAFYVGMAQFNSSSIIGKPIRVDNLLVAQKDFPKQMNWYDAKKACEALGNGWRLPTEEELNIFKKRKVKISGFENEYYWSSTENSFNDDMAWCVGFYSGGANSFYKDTFESKVRAVKDL